ncbi:MAG TPA: hypothetical protein VGE94_09145 [Chloroflexota bacterium]|jgi:hypothetical protein
MADQQSSGGTVLRGADGSIYFIRNEVLEECRQPDDMAKQLESFLASENEVQGFSINTSQDLQGVGQVSGPMSGAVGLAKKSTIMCPSLWSTTQ